MPKAEAVRVRRRAPQGATVAAEVYERLWRLNHGFQEIRGWLRDLGPDGLGLFSIRQVRPYADLVEEAQAAVTSFLLGELETRETDRAGRLFRQRQRREAAEEQDLR